MNRKRVLVVLGDENKSSFDIPFLKIDCTDLEYTIKLKQALQLLDEYEFVYLDNHSTLIQDLYLFKNNNFFHLVLNLCDSGFNNDSKTECYIPALLNLINLNYVGANSQCLSNCYNKLIIYDIAKQLSVPIPNTIIVDSADTASSIDIELPVIVKPVRGHGSYNITSNNVVNNKEDLIQIINKLKEHQYVIDKEQFVFVEEFLTGKDLTVGIIGNPPKQPYIVLPVIEEDYSLLPPYLPKICGYEAKWISDSMYSCVKSIQAVSLDANIKTIIVESSIKLFEKLDCYDYCRFDWRLDSNGQPKLLEVNPNPGWLWDGHLAKMCQYANINYSEMFRLILKAAEHRIYSKNNLNKNEKIIETELYN
ncbi:MAG: ATP-grasp domain-containing protein [Desulfobacterales bacterium]|nr:ATP-grasp domain-containing protein [Desulfobacterales bacterium]